MPFIVPLLGSPVLISGIDAGNEAWSFGFYGPILTAGNFAAKTALLTATDQLLDKAKAIILGAVKTTIYGNEVHYSYVQPTNGAAREIALGIQLKDATTQERFSLRLPTIDPTIPVYIANINAKDAVDPTTPAAIVDFIVALQALAVSPITGNPLDVIGIKVVRGNK